MTILKQGNKYLVYNKQACFMSSSLKVALSQALQYVYENARYTKAG